MKNWLLAAFLTFALPTMALADKAEEQPLPKDIPTQEKAFASIINQYTQERIVAQFGQPVKAEDVKIKGSGKIVASIWHYHKINTAEDGSSFPTTELDFIDGKVVQVIFLNHANLDETDNGKVYELPQGAPNQPEPNM